MTPDNPVFSKWQLQLLPSAGYAVAYTAQQPSVGFAFESQRGVHSFDSDRREDFWTRSNSLAFVPKDCSVTSESSAGGEYLSFIVPKAHQADGEETWRFNHIVSTEGIWAAFSLRKALLAGHLHDVLALETDLLTLLDVVRKVHYGRHNEPKAYSSMTDRRLKRVEEFVEAQLAQQITIAQLSECVGLSEGFFNRSFKAATGTTPHGYVVERVLSR